MQKTEQHVCIDLYILREGGLRLPSCAGAMRGKSMNAAVYLLNVTWFFLSTKPYYIFRWRVFILNWSGAAQGHICAERLYATGEYCTRGSSRQSAHRVRRTYAWHMGPVWPSGVGQARSSCFARNLSVSQHSPVPEILERRVCRESLTKCVFCPVMVGHSLRGRAFGWWFSETTAARMFTPKINRCCY